MLALNGSMGRLIISQWLQKNGVNTFEASEWNELTQILQENFQSKSYIDTPPNEASESKEVDMEDLSSVFIIVIDIGLLDLSTDIWKEQLSYLHKYFGKAKFAWILNHETSNTIKSELRQRRHLLMINRPIYKAKIIHIFEAVIKEQNLELQKYMNTLKATAVEGDLNECHEIDVIPSCAASSDESDKSEQEDSSFVSPFQNGDKRNGKCYKTLPSQNRTLNNYFVEFPQANFEENGCNMKNPGQDRPKEQHSSSSYNKEQETKSNGTLGNEQISLEGLRILLAEDTPVLQRVATIMLEKLGAKVVAVGDGLQAVDALKVIFDSDQSIPESPTEDVNSTVLPYDLILMDCQVRFLKGSSMFNLNGFLHAVNSYCSFSLSR